MSPIEYLRQFRVLEYAAFDLVAAFLGMWILSPLLSKLFLKIGVIIPKKSWVIWTLPIGIIAHLLVGTSTLMTQQFIDTGGSYILKVVIIALVIIGFRGVQRVGKSRS